MPACLEADDVAAEQAFDQFGQPGAHRHLFGVSPGDVPEADQCGSRQALAYQRWKQCEVVVLHQHDRVGPLRFFHDSVCEALVDSTVVVPIRLGESRPYMRHVTQGPQPAVGEAVAIPAHLRLRQPDATQPVRAGGVDSEPAVRPVHHLLVSVAITMRDPGASARARNRFERGDEAPRRLTDPDSAFAAVMRVRLAIRYNDHLVTLQC